MPPTASPPQPLTVERAPWLRGNLRVPGDVLLSHLAMAVAAISVGETTIGGAPQAIAIEAMGDALRGLGVRVEQSDDTWRISGLGVGGLLEPEAPLDLRDTGYGLHLLMGLAGGLDFPTTFKGDSRFSREGDELAKLVGHLGVTITSGQPGRTPITLHGPRLMIPADLTLPSGLPGARAATLLAALNARGVSRFRGAAPAEGHAERMLAAFGATIRPGDGDTLEIDGLPDLRAKDVTIPGDPSLAAMVATAAVIVPGSQVVVETVLLDPARVAVLSALVAMGAGVTLHNTREVGGERVADIVIRQQALRGNEFSERFMVLLAGDLPLLAAAAAVAEGDTSFVLPGDLALLHRGRLTDLAAAFRDIGVEAAAAEDAFHVRGTPRIRGGARITTSGDAGIAFAGLVLGMVAEERVTIDDQSAIEERFPGFVARFEQIGADFVREGEASR
jgi:3-phosphoshikimate 1-carboxyvinyltransferase